MLFFFLHFCLLKLTSPLKYNYHKWWVTDYISFYRNASCSFVMINDKNNYGDERRVHNIIFIYLPYIFFSFYHIICFISFFLFSSYFLFFSMYICIENENKVRVWTESSWTSSYSNKVSYMVSIFKMELWKRGHWGYIRKINLKFDWKGSIRYFRCDYKSVWTCRT